jgi:para-aminobenzoate synthetase component 1
MDLAFAPAKACRRKVPVIVRGPFWRCFESFPSGADAFLLDSALAGERTGRWSFAGAEPPARLTGRRRPAGAVGLDLELTVWREPDGTIPATPRRVVAAGDPYPVLRALRAAYCPEITAPAPQEAPFVGGLVGWFGYDAAWATEALPRRDGAGESGAPDLLFLVVDEVLSHDHHTGTSLLTVTGRGRSADAVSRDLEARTATWSQRLANTTTDTADRAATAPTCDQIPDLSGLTAAWDEAAYCAAVARCREHILAGDAFEICLTQQLSAPLRTTSWDLYAALRSVNPAPFAAFLRAGGVTVAGASPERFLSLDAAGRLESRPIKGTRPRGASPAEDRRLHDELRGAVKDGAENLMIVDLVRSDLGRVARIGTVTVPELRVVETYATVHQLVSTVQADLRPDRDAFDAVRACFPGGSMTGAPKLEAMAIIESLEPVSRGVYAGALGWFDHGGAMDLSIIIRTFVCADGRGSDNQVSFGVGGAITADSDPAAEYRETLDKARALLAALALVQDTPDAPDEGDRP